MADHRLPYVVAHMYPWTMEGGATGELHLAPAQLPCRPLWVMMSADAAALELLRLGPDEYSPGGLALQTFQLWEAGPIRIPVAQYGTMHEGAPAGRSSLVLHLRNPTAIRVRVAGHLEGTHW